MLAKMFLFHYIFMMTEQMEKDELLLPLDGFLNNINKHLLLKQ